MEDSTIINILSEEMSQSIGGDESSVQGERQTAYQYYLGILPPKPDDTQKSGVTSTDVADAIEWIMPEVVKSFTQTNEVVTFDPVVDGDEDDADMESDYTYGVLMKENDGFTVIHTLVKDALMQKNGVMKVYYDGTPTEKTEDYTSLSKEQLQMLVGDPDVEVMAMSGTAIIGQERMKLEQAEAQVKQAQQAAQQQIQPMQQQLEAIKKRGQMMMQKMQSPAHGKPQQMPPQAQQMMQQGKQIQQQIQQIMKSVPKIAEVCIDVKVKRTTKKGQVTVLCVAPEDFRVNSRHNSVNLKDARFLSHNTCETRGQLLKDYPHAKDVIAMASPSNRDDYNDTAYRFRDMDETVIQDGQETSDSSQDLIDVYESYLNIDIDDDGIGKYMMIRSVGSDDTPIDIIEKVEVEENPFFSGVINMMSHKFLGQSMYDRLKEIQDEKTSLWRTMNDNLALINNKEYEVVEGKVNIDDLLVSRPGGIKRVKAIGMLREIQTSPLPPDSYMMFEYLDSVRTARSGVTPEGPGQNHNIGSETAHGIERLMTKKEEMVSLMVRVIAETAIKPAVIRIRDLLIRHNDVAKDYKFRGTWKKLNPSRWRNRSMVTVRVGTGSGSQDRQVAALTKLAEFQLQIKQDPSQALVNEQKTFTLIDDLSKAAGLTGAREYFVDPKSPEGKKQKEQVDKKQQEAEAKQNEVDKAFAQSQMELAKAEQMKANAQLENVKVKAESERVKGQNEALKTQLDQQKNDTDAELTYQEQISSIEEARGKQELESVKIELDAMKSDSDTQMKLDELQFKYDELFAKMELEQDKLDSAEKTARQTTNNEDGTDV